MSCRKPPSTARATCCRANKNVGWVERAHILGRARAIPIDSLRAGRDDGYRSRAHQKGVYARLGTGWGALPLDPSCEHQVEVVLQRVRNALIACASPAVDNL